MLLSNAVKSVLFSRSTIFLRMPEILKLTKEPIFIVSGAKRAFIALLNSLFFKYAESVGKISQRLLTGSFYMLSVALQIMLKRLLIIDLFASFAFLEYSSCEIISGAFNIFNIGTITSW